MNHLQVNTTEFITTQGNAFEIICHAQVILRLECVINFGMAYSFATVWLHSECRSYISEIVVLLRIGIVRKWSILVLIPLNDYSEVKGASGHSSEMDFLCYMEERVWFGTTWRWANDDSVHLGWTTPLMAPLNIF